MNSLRDPDSWTWIALTGFVMLAVGVLRLAYGYNSWDMDKDLATAGTMSGVYFSQAILKKVIRDKQAKDSEDAK